MKRIHRNCETCGGPLPANATGKRIVCQYCGSIYENDEFCDSPKAYEPPQIPPPRVVPSINYHEQQDLQIKRTGKTIPIVVTIVVLMATGFFITLLSSPKRTSNERSSSIVVPAMLVNLPDNEFAGESVPYSNWVLTVNPEIKVDGSSIGISLSVKNWNESEEIFRFRPNNMKLYDNHGNNYPIRFGNCSEDNAYYERQVSFKARETKDFSSHDYWCSDDTDLPVFFGTIPLDVKNLYLQLTEFGVFSKITFVFDL